MITFPHRTVSRQRLASGRRRYEQAETREDQILALLTRRQGERLTATEVATALGTEVENIRATLSRLCRRQAIGMSHEIRTYQVSNSTCRHKARLWFVP